MSTWKKVLEDLDRLGVWMDRVIELEAATTPEQANRMGEEFDNHAFQPVKDHPDDDECTYCADGTFFTYCGLPEAEHEWSER